MSQFDILVIGTSAGGLAALDILLHGLNSNINIPIVIVQHLSPDSGSSIVSLLKKYSKMEVTEPLDKEQLLGNHIYIAPADYHVMIEKDKSIGVNLGPKENFCRPAIDVLFETAAEVFFERTLGVILTGANKDGTKGCLKIKSLSGTTIVQDPTEALISVMPLGVIDAGAADYVLPLNEIVKELNKILKEK